MTTTTACLDYPGDCAAEPERPDDEYWVQRYVAKWQRSDCTSDTSTTGTAAWRKVWEVTFFLAPYKCQRTADNPRFEPNSDGIPADKYWMKTWTKTCAAPTTTDTTNSAPCPTCTWTETWVQIATPLYYARCADPPSTTFVQPIIPAAPGRLAAVTV